MSLLNRIGEPLRGATFGFPIKHSVGPAVHTFVAQLLGLPWTFTHGEYAEEEQVWQHIQSADFGFGAITMPFKSTIMTRLDHIADDAKAIGAVNTISLVKGSSNASPQYHGHNTDAAGIAQVFLEKDAMLRRIPQRIGLVIGSGGAARAAIWAMVFMLHCPCVLVVARSATAVKAMIDDMQAAVQAQGGKFPLSECVFHVASVAHAQRLLDQGITPSLAVSCIPDAAMTRQATPTATEGKTAAEDVMYAVLDLLLVGRLHRHQAQTSPCMLIDMCFKPLVTSIIRTARADGWHTISGIEVLGAQLIEQWRIWLGTDSSLFASIPQSQVRDKMRQLAASSSALQSSDDAILSFADRLKAMPQAVMSASLGYADAQSIEEKVAAAAAERFDGIEIFYECLRVASLRLVNKSIEQLPSNEELLAGAQYIRQLCDSHQVRIVALQPWLNYVGLRDRQERDRRVQDVLPLWFEVADILGTDVIQVPSMMFKKISLGNSEVVVADLRAIAEAGLTGRQGQGKPPIRFAYEAMAFGAWTSRWQDAWKEVEAVDLPNFGIVLDTFQILGECWADPASESGVLYDGELRLQKCLDDLRTTFAGHQAKQTLNRQKVFYIQIGDAERMTPPLTIDHALFDPTMHANSKMAWNRSCRNFAGEGYLPLLPLLRVIFEDIGFQGIVSAEVMNAELKNADKTIPLRNAQRAMAGWRRCQEMLLDDGHK
ncbi:4-hydroxyphenylpyruvate dioxygenase [Pseudozyma hubeiensis SY62]|uniref:4-hydroxyphenylpyruvate dioxygenase n=1 Tax=Pseudozyma hubeiensis (strain SY62) TaxID=1305764 RepID=R9PAX8_PSEHS|nr:4-hydroxyphenylpyruvate dioxygenase [Pseudozyma hubeiensis SY62]GAC98504.1 4-hydroxyphenylpyruvate dioxygenase [Pseudozyma hubeiensis SY62]